MSEVIITSGNSTINVNITGAGPRGQSAYETWLALGNVGTRQDFLDSQFDEPARVLNENTRKQSEVTRIENEITREQQETLRQEADILRGQTVEAIEAHYAPRLTTAEEQINDLAEHIGTERNFIISDTEPDNPTNGMVWIDTSIHITKELIYLKMDETSGTLVADSSGNGKDATNNGCTIVEGIKPDGGKALQGDGINDYIELPSSFTLASASKFRVSFYAKKLSNQADWRSLFAHYHTPIASLGFYISYNATTRGGICFRLITVSGDSDNVQTNYNPPIGQTIKIELWYTGSIAKFTIWTVASDGTLTEVYSTSISVSGELNAGLTSPRLLASSNAYTGPDEFANWVVDDLKITED